MGPEEIFLLLARALLAEFNVTYKTNGAPVDEYSLAYAAQGFAEAQPNEAKKDDPMEPSPTLLCKVGSIVVHTDEFLSPHGHPVDKAAIDDLLKDPEVIEWLTAMRHCALVPEKRNA